MCTATRAPLRLRPARAAWCLSWVLAACGARTGLAVPERDAAPAPADAVDPLRAVGLALRSHHSCAALADGTARCWGTNGSGELGDGTRGPPSLRPVAVTLVDHVAQLAAGGAIAINWPGYTCARRADASLVCWGASQDGQLGSPLERVGTVTVSRAAEPVAEIALGERHACSRRDDGTVRCWGYGGDGQLGDGRIDPVGTDGHTGDARPVAGLAGATALGLGYDFTCALTRDGAVQCWGGNRVGQLGDGGSRPRAEPGRVALAEPATQLAVGQLHACALGASGAVWCWGRGDLGQFGDGRRANSATPVRIAGLDDVAELAAGQDVACARRGDGSVWCWGTTTELTGLEPGVPPRAMPGPVPGIDDARGLAVGGLHACVRRAGDAVWCWGANPSGELGDGTRVGRARPAPVPR